VEIDGDPAPNQSILIDNVSIRVYCPLGIFFCSSRSLTIRRVVGGASGDQLPDLSR